MRPRRDTESWLGSILGNVGRVLRGARSERRSYAPARSSDYDDAALELRAQQIGREWLAAARAASARESGIFSNRLVERALGDDAFRVQLLRFVDVFPMLRSPESIHSVLLEYLSAPGVELPLGLGLGLRAASLAKGAASRVISQQVESMASQFIAGRDVSDALPRLRARWSAGAGFSVDLLGEACVSDAEAQAYAARYLHLIDALADAVAEWPAQDALERDHLGALPRVSLSLKVSAFDARAEGIDLQRGIERVHERIAPILDRALRRGVFVSFDMEQHTLKELVLGVFERACERSEFAAGIALQAYLRSAHDDARRVVDWARRRGRQVTVRLVKGAYWDYELIRAEREGWPAPVWSHKAETDASFERVTRMLVHEMPRQAGEGGVKLALGTHNARSIAVALAAVERAGLPAAALELQMLYGMADALKDVARERGLRVREYVPLGELIPGMSYFVRRLLENTSNQSWVRARSVTEAADDVLLRAPDVDVNEPAPLALESAPERHELSPAIPELGDGRAFHSEPTRDFSDRAQRESFAAAVSRARVPRAGEDTSVEQVDALLARAAGAFPEWRSRDVLERAQCLVTAARQLRARRDELCGVLIRENGKIWRDADAEVCEAIDFLEYYARQAPGLERWTRLGRFAGELDQLAHQPRGVAVVIAPWNFPVAIPCGMVAAALVTGNAVVLKPAEQTPGCARELCDALWRAGVPRDVLQLACGPGELGAALVRDPRVALIAFTGSQAVGLDIVEAAGRTQRDQLAVKKVVCEMGGKNAIVVDDTADLDDAVIAVRDGAFGFQGQKCSACSRVIVLDGIHDAFLARLIESTRSLVIGDPLEPDTDLGPLIDAAAASKTLEYIAIGRGEGKLELAIEPSPALAARAGRPYIGPHIFSGIERRHRLANEEIFGPVLSVLRAKSFEAALEEANATAYKLTGGVFSRTPSHLELARRELRVGNLYLNRGITGARVGRQPFGGFGRSGVGSQAGGPSYLLQFVEPRSVCENTLRRGFSPEL